MKRDDAPVRYPGREDFHPAIRGRWAVLRDGKLADSRFTRRAARKTAKRLKEEADGLGKLR